MTRPTPKPPAEQPVNLDDLPLTEQVRHLRTVMGALSWQVGEIVERERQPLQVTPRKDGTIDVTGLTAREAAFLKLLRQVDDAKPAPILGTDVVTALRAEAAAEARMIATHLIDQAMTIAAEHGRQAAEEYVRQLRTVTTKDVIRDAHGDIVRISESTDLA